MKIKLTLAVTVLLLAGVAFSTPLTPQGVASGDTVAPAVSIGVAPVVSIEQEPPAAPGLVPCEPAAEVSAAQNPAQDAPQNPNGVGAPQVCIPTPTGGNCCIWQIEKRVEGKRSAAYTPPYNCPVGIVAPPAIPTMRGSLTVRMILASAGPTCDPIGNIIPNNSTLDAQGPVIRRNDNFAHFNGRFTIRNPAGAPLFTGHIETIDRLGSHRLFVNCEACNQISHFEGWLVGQGVGGLSTFTIRALVQSRGTVPSPAAPSTPVAGSISGTLVRCP